MGGKALYLSRDVWERCFWTDSEARRNGVESGKRWCPIPLEFMLIASRIHRLGVDGVGIFTPTVANRSLLSCFYRGLCYIALSGLFHGRFGHGFLGVHRDIMRIQVPTSSKDLHFAALRSKRRGDAGVIAEYQVRGIKFKILTSN